MTTSMTSTPPTRVLPGEFGSTLNLKRGRAPGSESRARRSDQQGVTNEAVGATAEHLRGSCRRRHYSPAGQEQPIMVAAQQRLRELNIMRKFPLMCDHSWGIKKKATMEFKHVRQAPSREAARRTILERYESTRRTCYYRRLPAGSRRKPGRQPGPPAGRCTAAAQSTEEEEEERERAEEGDCRRHHGRRGRR